MAIPKVQYDSVESVKGIATNETQLSKRLLEVLKASLVAQKELKVGDVRNVKELKAMQEFMKTNKANMAVDNYTSINDSYEMAIKAIENSAKVANEKSDGIFKSALDDVTSSIPTTKDFMSAFMSQNPLVGMSWKLVKGSYDLTKKEFDRMKKSGNKQKTAIQALEAQTKAVDNLSDDIDDSTSEQTSEVVKAINANEKRGRKPLYTPLLTQISDKLDALSNIDKSDYAVRLSNDESNKVTRLPEEGKQIVKKLDSVQDTVEDGIQAVIKRMDKADADEVRRDKLQRLKDTNTASTYGIDKANATAKKNLEDESSQMFEGLKGKMMGIRKMLAPLLGLLSLTLIPLLLGLLKPFKILFNFLWKFGSMIIKHLPMILRIGSKVAIIGTIVMAIWDFVDGFIKAGDIIEGADIYDRFVYGMSNIAAGLIKLVDDILGWFGVGFLEDGTTQEEITQAIYKFRENFVNSLKSAFNMVMDYLDSTFLSAIVPSFRFDTKDTKFKDENGKVKQQKQAEDIVSVEKSLSFVETALNVIPGAVPIMKGINMLFNNDKAESFDKNVKDMEAKSASNNSSKTSSVVNSGNSVTNISNGGGGSSFTPTNTSTQDMSFRKALA